MRKLLISILLVSVLFFASCNLAVISTQEDTNTVSPKEGYGLITVNLPKITGSRMAAENEEAATMTKYYKVYIYKPELDNTQNYVEREAQDTFSCELLPGTYTVLVIAYQYSREFMTGCGSQSDIVVESNNTTSVNITLNSSLVKFEVDPIDDIAYTPDETFDVTVRVQGKNNCSCITTPTEWVFQMYDFYNKTYASGNYRYEDLVTLNKSQDGTFSGNKTLTLKMSENEFYIGSGDVDTNFNYWPKVVINDNNFQIKTSYKWPVSGIGNSNCVTPTRFQILAKEEIHPGSVSISAVWG